MAPSTAEMPLTRKAADVPRIGWRTRSRLQSRSRPPVAPGREAALRTAGTRSSAAAMLKGLQDTATRTSRVFGGPVPACACSKPFVNASHGGS